MRIVFAAGEALPYIKSGGLADVIGSLPKELVKKGHECYVILPKYQDIKFPETLEYVTNFSLWIMNNILEDLVYMGMMMIMKDLHFMTLQFLNAYLV